MVSMPDECVNVYRNLLKKVWSIRSCRTRRVVEHAAKLVVEDVVFRVGAGGRARALREGRRNVHAYVMGRRGKHVPSGEQVRVRYNPFRAGTFTDEEGHPVTKARAVVFAEDGTAYAVGPVFALKCAVQCVFDHGPET